MFQGLAIINVYFSICVYQVVPIINNRVCEVSTPAMDNIDTVHPLIILLTCYGVTYCYRIYIVNYSLL